MAAQNRGEQNRTKQNRTELNRNKPGCPKTSKYNKTVSQNKRLVITVLYDCTVGSHQGVVCVGGVSKLAKNSPASKR